MACGSGAVLRYIGLSIYGAQWLNEMKVLTRRSRLCYGALMTKSKTQRPAIFDNVDNVDVLTTVPGVDVKAGAFREGMILLDEDLGSPAALLDHKVGRAQDSGVTWMAHDLVRGGLLTLRFHVNGAHQVAAR